MVLGIEIAEIFLLKRLNGKRIYKKKYIHPLFILQDNLAIILRTKTILTAKVKILFTFDFLKRLTT